MFSRLNLKQRHQKLVHKTFQQYIKATRQFWEIAERRAIYRSPNNQALLKAAFGLQILLIDRQSLRYEHLIRASSGEQIPWKTLADISHRLDSEWSEADERSIASSVPRYAYLSKEVDRLSASLDATALSDCITVLEQDSKYRSARQAIAMKVQQLRDRLNAVA